MPRLDNSKALATYTGHFGFSAEKLDKCAEVSSNYSLVTIAVDDSISVDDFKSGLINCVKKAVLACHKCPTKENLMIRLVRFGSQYEEYHGFKFLTDINVDDYDNLLTCVGSTALNDAIFSSVEATVKYGSDLSDQGYQVNAVIIVITDGMNNSSKIKDNERYQIKDMLKQAKMDEKLESILTTLVGVNTQNGNLTPDLQAVKDDVGFLNYIDLADASEKSLAKLQNWMSQSVSSSSQNIAAGKPSQLITF